MVHQEIYKNGRETETYERMGEHAMPLKLYSKKTTGLSKQRMLDKAWYAAHAAFRVRRSSCAPIMPFIPLVTILGGRGWGSRD